MNNNQLEENEEEILIKQKIETELLKCPTPEICAKMNNFNSKAWCISYVYRHVVSMGMTIMEGIGQLEMYLLEENN